MNELQHEDLENHASLNHPFKNEQQFEIINYPAKEKTDELLEEETRGVDFKGNIRYFCPKCNVRYIEFKYLKTHLKECGNIHECQICQQKFKQKRTFTAHQKKKHYIPATPDSNNGEINSSDKSFQFLLHSS